MEKIKIIILAGGKGKRMGGDLPKVLAPLHGKPLIKHLLESVHSVLDEKPIAVVGHKAEFVKAELGDLCFYIEQKEQLGTGHAVSCAEGECADAEHIVVLQGDQPFTQAETIKNLIAAQLASSAKITFATTEVPDFLEWRQVFSAFGRIKREEKKVLGIVEAKDATEEEKNIKEVNAGCYIFEAKWLWPSLHKIDNQNTQKEYYITDLIKLAIEEGQKVETISINPKEALGANSKEELEILEKLVV